MIGWTRTRKACKEHGLVLRGRPDWDSKQDYCPACGERLILISVPYVFQVYLHPFLGVCMSAVFVLMSMLYLCDMRGCVQEERIVAAHQKSINDAAAMSLPPQWKNIYVAMSTTNKGTAYKILRKSLKGKKLDLLVDDQVKLFLDLMFRSVADDAFALMEESME